MGNFVIDSRSLYNFVDTWATALQPFSNFARQIAVMLDEREHNAYTSNLYKNIPPILRYMNRSTTTLWYLAGDMTRMYNKPEWEINQTEINRKSYFITIDTVLERPFCKLIHFAKKTHIDQPKMLVIAPMSGHYATLLRDTVNALLPCYDVYITDWINAREVPMSEGGFDLDDFVDYIIEFTKTLAPNLHVMAVCQPTVPLFMASCLVSKNAETNIPASCILIGGPIDTSQNPTEPNKLASENSISWFEHHVISLVPSHYPGSMRLVYPGFMQLAGFMAMNPSNHAKAIRQAIQNYIKGEFAAAEKTVNFYNEYFSVMDMTAEFYLQTINSIFKENKLANGDLKSRGRPIDPLAITKIPMLAIEAEKDDICGRGQTEAALKLCKNLPESKKRYHLQKNVGHYGQFSGSKFRNFVLPVICDFTNTHGRKN